MTVSTAATVHEVAQELLDASEAILATTVGGPVALAYLSPGLPAIDFQCDQVAVYIAAIADEGTSPIAPIPVTGYRRRRGWVNIVGFSAMAIRCVSSGDTAHNGYQPPNAAVLSSDARKVMEDGWALWNGISTAIIEDGLFGGTCNDIKFVSLAPMIPQGGVAGWVLTVTAEMPGYR